MRYIVRLWIWSFVRESFHAGWSQYHSTMVSLKDDKNIANKTSKYYKYWLCYICNISTMQLENNFFYSWDLLKFVSLFGRLFVCLIVCFDIIGINDTITITMKNLFSVWFLEKGIFVLLSIAFFLFVCLFVCLFYCSV